MVEATHPMSVDVRIQEDDFDVSHELVCLRESTPGAGALANFVGVVRESNEGSQVSAMLLEHYPGMTERSIADIIERASSNWPILAATVIHRVGKLVPSDQIVLVAVAASHRGDAFSACEYIMDYLKTRAPFWKKEFTPEGERWVEARASDEVALERWQ